ncbi:uncharacterized protein BDW43DRAFT_283014 [Aspergillus alliaceus]|uniref:uncharacterized protein n=1 Tax=Petromyces alliaceus TaxID=209559 RepID=UPI0012A3B336|nr:uncharacterized protein BDW43DRAFT_283014 [Aspergillus alliaceus]KAB8231198.1 hypothetical protein BDW43DRAFT_283014 [Aspergillus alliaceus]
MVGFKALLKLRCIHCVQDCLLISEMHTIAKILQGAHSKLDHSVCSSYLLLLGRLSTFSWR